MTTLKPSSASSGFFQSLPTVPPQYTSSGSQSSSAQHRSDDPVLDRILSLYLAQVPPTVSTSLHNFSRLVLHPSTLRHMVDCETNQPTLHTLTTFGEENKTNPLWTSEGWRVLKDIGIREGVVGYGYKQGDLGVLQTWNRRVHQFATLHLWHGTAALTTCPMAMTDGAAVLLARHLQDPDGDQPGRRSVFTEAYRRLISLDPQDAWTSGQWMTERSGGSDVSGTETVARRLSNLELERDNEGGRDRDAVGMPLGSWRVDGFKWFSSATDADAAVLLAQTSKGLSAFYAPMRRRAKDSSPQASAVGDEGFEPAEMNGVRIQRLKNKLGTKGLPTAELEINGMRAWLIGEEGKGIKEIASILNLTRLHTAGGAAGYWARGLAVSRAYTTVRKVRGGLLQDNPQHLRWMAGETVKYQAGTHLLFFGAALLGASEQGWDVVQDTKAQGLIPRDKTGVDLMLRILTPVMKAQVSLGSVEGLRACMESLGGVGYCENNEDGGLLNLARIFRDAVVGTIWEGTLSVMAEDVVRVLKDVRLARGNVLENVFGEWVHGVLRTCQRASFREECLAVQERWAALAEMVREMDAHELHWRGRQVLDHLEAIACACLLMYDASTDGDEVAVEVARRWVWSKALQAKRSDQPSWREEVPMDRRIFLGPRLESPAAAQAKL